MIDLASLRIFVCTTPTHMQSSFDRLMGLAQQTFNQDPLSGHLFLFLNRTRDRIKILYWDGDGLAIWYRRLEQGTFQMPTIADDQKSAEIRSDELTMLLRGVDLNSVRRRKRFSIAS